MNQPGATQPIASPLVAEYDAKRAELQLVFQKLNMSYNVGFQADLKGLNPANEELDSLVSYLATRRVQLERAEQLSAELAKLIAQGADRDSDFHHIATREWHWQTSN